MDKILKILKEAKRHGTQKDYPEGSRYIVFSETLINEMIELIEHCIGIPILIQALEDFEEGELIIDNGVHVTNNDKVNSFFVGEKCIIGDLLQVDRRDGKVKKVTSYDFDNSKFRKELAKLNAKEYLIQNAPSKSVVRRLEKQVK